MYTELLEEKALDVFAYYRFCAENGSIYVGVRVRQRCPLNVGLFYSECGVRLIWGPLNTGL